MRWLAYLLMVGLAILGSRPVGAELDPELSEMLLAATLADSRTFSGLCDVQFETLIDLREADPRSYPEVPGPVASWLAGAGQAAQTALLRTSRLLGLAGEKADDPNLAHELGMVARDLSCFVLAREILEQADDDVEDAMAGEIAEAWEKARPSPAVAVLLAARRGSTRLVEHSLSHCSIGIAGLTCAAALDLQDVDSKRRWLEKLPDQTLAEIASPWSVFDAETRHEAAALLGVKADSDGWRAQSSRGVAEGSLELLTRASTGASGFFVSREAMDFIQAQAWRALADDSPPPDPIASLFETLRYHPDLAAQVILASPLDDHGARAVIDLIQGLPADDPYFSRLLQACPEAWPAVCATLVERIDDPSIVREWLASLPAGRLRSLGAPFPAWVVDEASRLADRPPFPS